MVFEVNTNKVQFACALDREENDQQSYQEPAMTCTILAKWIYGMCEVKVEME